MINVLYKLHLHLFYQRWSNIQKQEAQINSPVIKPFLYLIKIFIFMREEEPRHQKRNIQSLKEQQNISFYNPKGVEKLKSYKNRCPLFEIIYKMAQDSSVIEEAESLRGLEEKWVRLRESKCTVDYAIRSLDDLFLQPKDVIPRSFLSLETNLREQLCRNDPTKELLKGQIQKCQSEIKDNIINREDFMKKVLKNMQSSLDIQQISLKSLLKFTKRQLLKAKQFFISHQTKWMPLSFQWEGCEHKSCFLVYQEKKMIQKRIQQKNKLSTLMMANEQRLQKVALIQDFRTKSLNLFQRDKQQEMKLVNFIFDSCLEGIQKDSLLIFQQYQQSEEVFRQDKSISDYYDNFIIDLKKMLLQEIISAEEEAYNW